MKYSLRGTGMGGVLGLLVILIVAGAYLQPTLATIAWFVATIAPYVAGAVGLFLLVIIVLRLLNAWRS